MNLRNLSVLAYAHGFTMWSYFDRAMTAADLLRPGFFNAAGDRADQKLLARGDIIICQAARGCIQVWISDVCEAGVLVELMASTFQPSLHQALQDYAYPTADDLDTYHTEKDS